jgi:predicted ATPase
MTTMADLFVGREWERDEVAGAIASSVGQRGELVLIGGEAGIGKTCLAREVIGSATGSAVVWAT